ncbi:MAG: hypothetical protein NTZ67_08170 [Gammaproteobacteria bacterium]|nr:hypothetical protein [Gammaproteobacteria bacterium]
MHYIHRWLSSWSLGLWLEKCINFLTNSIRETLKVHKINFPLVFPLENNFIKDLTHKFDSRNEIFHLLDYKFALSYSPDPNLLLWLSNKQLKRAKLPYAIETSSIFLRKIKSGGINGLDKVRQFSFPGVFTLTSEKNTEESVFSFLKESSFLMNAIFGKFWKTKITTTNAFYQDRKEHFDAIEQLTGAVVELTFIEKQNHYFSYKLGLYADASYSDLMIFNLQWDNSNAKLFNITIDEKDTLVILHATLAGAVNRVFPALIGNGLERKNSIFPPLVAPYHIGVVHDDDTTDKNFVNSIINFFNDNYFRYFFPGKMNFNAKIAEIDKFWIPYLIIVPKGATTINELKVFDRTLNKIQISFDDLVKNLLSLATTSSILTHKDFELDLPF